MATVVNNPAPSERIIEVNRSSDASVGWAVSIIVLIAVIVGLFAWIHYHRPYVAPSTSTGGANINVTLPPSTSGDNGTAPTSGTSY